MIPAGSRILIVEDEYFSAYFLESALGREGYEVIGSVSTGDEAIERAGESRPDIVLMDIGLAGRIDGLSAARSIRERCQPFIVFISGYQDDALMERALALGRSSYLVKPVKLATLHGVFEQTDIASTPRED